LGWFAGHIPDALVHQVVYGTRCSGTSMLFYGEGINS
jgi:hypothetical protein